MHECIADLKQFIKILNAPLILAGESRAAIQHGNA
jgi:hypothetical protein